MKPEVKWTVATGLFASLLAASITAALTRPALLSLIGWFVFFEIGQLPFIAEARKGRLDPCTAWVRRTIGRERAA